MTNSIETKQRLPVLIVGAGPVGLLMAILLKLQGIAVRLIDEKEGPTQTSNALGIQPRSLELLDTLGLTEKALSRGLLLSGLTMSTQKKQLINIDFSSLPSQFPFILSLPQSETEALLTERLTELGGEVEWQTKLLHLDNHDTHVTLQIATPFEQQTLDAEWVVGCDGYHSSTRQLSHTDFVGTDLPQHFIMIDCLLESTLSNNQAHGIFGADGGMLAFPMKNKWRLIAEISHDKEFKDVKTGSLEIFTAICQRRSPVPIRITEVLWASGFWVHEKMASQFRQGRLFLAGDAAHVHSPAGGQGMNTGLQDAFNLGWKLALVINGIANDQLLNTYQSERQPVAKEVLSLSNKLTQFISLKNPVLTCLRNWMLPCIGRATPLIKKMANQISELSIHYPHPHHPLIGQRAAKFNPGYQFLLVIFKPSAETPAVINFIENKLPGRVKILHANNPNDGSGFGYWLIRPDQYIGFVGNTLDELKTYHLTM